MDTTGYYRIIPEYIASDKSISGDVKIFYGLLTSLASKYGYCYATNAYLSKVSEINSRTIQRYLNKLIEKGHIVVEIIDHNERKIWTKEHWNNREELLKRYGSYPPEVREKFNQRFVMYDKPVMGGTTDLSQVPLIPPNKEDKENRLIDIHRHREAAGPPICIQNAHKKSSPNSTKTDQQKLDKLPEQLPDLMKGPLPTPGPRQMVLETLELLSHPINFKGKRYIMSVTDRRYFLGFSPATLIRAMEYLNRHKKGSKIHNLCSYLFAQCCKIRKE